MEGEPSGGLDMGKAWEIGCKVPGNPARVSWEEHSICCIQKGVNKLATQQHPPHGVRDALQLLLCLHNKDAMLLVWLSSPGSPRCLHLLQPHILQSAQQSPSLVFGGQSPSTPSLYSSLSQWPQKPNDTTPVGPQGHYFPGLWGFIQANKLFLRTKCFHLKSNRTNPFC